MLWLTRCTKRTPAWGNTPSTLLLLGTKYLARSGLLERVQIAVAPAKPIHVPYVDQAAGFFFKTYDSEAAKSVKSVYKYIPHAF